MSKKAPFSRILAIDFETKWSSKSGYTLSKMTTEEYIRDELFHAYGVSYMWLDDPSHIGYVRHDQLQEFFDGIDWTDTAVLAQNAMFDAAILSWVYGHSPAFIFDTLSMGRALYGVEVGNSLKMLAERFGLPPKGEAVYSTDGLDELPPDIDAELEEYCKHDTFLCVEIFKRMVPSYPKKELRLIDMTLKMFVNPRIKLDTDMLEKALIEEKEKRESLLARLGVQEKELSSNVKFAGMLESLGMQVPMKKKKPTPKNPNPEGMTYAFAKNDALFQELLNSDREDVALLCEARLKVKSTIGRTRAQRFYDISKRGALPVPLSYYGAHTGRWAAAKGSAINMQNMGRGSILRSSVMAPEGHVLVVSDLSQIEPRVLAWLAEYKDMLDIFAGGGDPYAMFARNMFGIPDLTKDSHPILRQSAKSALLGCGYGLGWASFSAQLLTGFLGAPPMRYTRDFAKQLGVTKQDIVAMTSNEDMMARLKEIPHTCTLQELIIHCASAKKIIDKYRSAAIPVVDLWKMCDTAIGEILFGGGTFKYKFLRFEKERIVLPSGMALKYDGVERNDEGQWIFGKSKRHPFGKKLYGGSVVENITQAVARCIMTDQMLNISERYPVVLTVHDECCIVAPEDEAEEAYAFMTKCMSTAPEWIPDIPLACDGGYDVRYGNIK